MHISDLAALYTLLAEKILQSELIPSGEKGYYFPVVHKTHWWSVMQRLAEALHARGLVKEPKVETWPSDEMAADHLGFPRPFVRAMGTSRYAPCFRRREYEDLMIDLVGSLSR